MALAQPIIEYADFSYFILKLCTMITILLNFNDYVGRGVCDIDRLSKVPTSATFKTISSISGIFRNFSKMQQKFFSKNRPCFTLVLFITSS